MRITEAAQRLDMTPRMLRYRESLGLLPALRHGHRPGAGPAVRRSANQGSANQGSANRRPSGQLPGGQPPDRAAPDRAAPDRQPPDRQPPDRQPPDRQPPDGHDPRRAGTASLARAPAALTWPAEPTGQHRHFGDADLAAVALGLSIERRYDISPAALAFGIRVLADPRVRADVAELGRRIGRIQPPPARALDFEQERAQRLLRLDQRPVTQPVRK